jgi:hypothetical protein
VLAAIALDALAGHKTDQRLSNRKTNRLAHRLILESNGLKKFEPPLALARPSGGLGGRGQIQGKTRKKLTFQYVCFENEMVKCGCQNKF